MTTCKTLTPTAVRTALLKAMDAPERYRDAGYATIIPNASKMLGCEESDLLAYLETNLRSVVMVPWTTTETGFSYESPWGLELTYTIECLGDYPYLWRLKMDDGVNGWESPYQSLRECMVEAETFMMDEIAMETGSDDLRPADIEELAVKYEID